MISFDDLKATALKIYNATQRKENTAKRIGGLFSDILDYITVQLSTVVKQIVDLAEIVNLKVDKSELNNVQSFAILKTYATIAAMNADVTAPIGSNGKAILAGQLVAVASDGIYRYVVSVSNAKSWELVSKYVYADGAVTIKTIYNVSQANNNYAYADSTTARNAVAVANRAKTQIISYQLASGKVINEQYVGADVNGWATAANWKNVGGDASTTRVLKVVAADQTSLLPSYTKNGYLLDYFNGTEATTTNPANIVSKFPLIVGQKYKITGLPNVVYDRFFSFYATNVGNPNRVDFINLANTTECEFIAKYPYISFYVLHDFGSSNPIWDIRSTVTINGLGYEKLETMAGDTVIPSIPEILHKGVAVQKDRTSEIAALKKSKTSLENGVEKPIVGGSLGVVLSKFPLIVGKKYKITGLPNISYGFPFLYFYRSTDNTTSAASDVLDNATEYEFVAKYPYVSFYLLHNIGTGFPMWDVQSLVKIFEFTNNTVLSNRDSSVEVEVDSDPDIKVTATSKNITKVTALVPDKILKNFYAGETSITANTGWDCVFFKVEPNMSYTIDLGVKLRGNLPVAFYNNTGSLRANVGDAYCSLAAGGRRYVDFKTDGQVKVIGFNIRGVGFDVTSSYKMYKTPTSQQQISTIFAPLSPLIDLTGQTSIQIPTPIWCKVNLIGVQQFLNADERVPFVFEYTDSNGYYFRCISKMAWQGHGSLQYLKKNFKHSLVTEDGNKISLKIGNWLPRNSFHTKANAQDSSYVMNNGAANFFREIYKTRPFGNRNPWDKPFDKTVLSVNKRFKSGAMPTIDGIPCMMYFNSCPYGIYTFNLNPFIENYEVQSTDEKAFVFKSEENNCKFDNPNLKSVWEELKTDKVGDLIADATFLPMKNITTWANTVSAANYKIELPNWVDISFMIDYYLGVMFFDLMDNIINNLIFVTYDSIKFYPLFYDGDTGIGMDYNGAMTRPTTAATFDNRGSKLFDRFYANYTTEIAARYKELRDKGIFTAAKVEEVFGGFADRYIYENVEMDLDHWVALPSNKSGNLQSVPQIVTWCTGRISYLDTKFGYKV